MKTCYTAGSDNGSKADLKVFWSLMWRLVVQAAAHVLPCRSGCVLFQSDQKKSDEFLHGGLAQYSPAFPPEYMLRNDMNRFRVVLEWGFGSFDCSFALACSFAFFHNHKTKS